MDKKAEEVGQKVKSKRCKKKVVRNKGKTCDQSIQVGRGVIKKGRWEYAEGQINDNKNQAEGNSQQGKAEGTPIGKKENPNKQEFRGDKDNEICTICRQPVGASPGSLFAHLNSKHFRPKWGTFSIETYRRLNEMPNLHSEIHILEDLFKKGVSGSN